MNNVRIVRRFVTSMVLTFSVITIFKIQVDEDYQNNWWIWWLIGVGCTFILAFVRDKGEATLLEEFGITSNDNRVIPLVWLAVALGPLTLAFTALRTIFDAVCTVVITVSRGFVR